VKFTCSKRPGEPPKRNSPVVKAGEPPKGYCPKAKKLRPPEGKNSTRSPKAKERDRQLSVLTIAKRGVEGGETVCSDWLQQTVKRIEGRELDTAVCITLR